MFRADAACERVAWPPWPRVEDCHVRDFIGAAAGATLCEYHVAEAIDLRCRQQALDSVGGGALSVVGMGEIIVGSPEPTAASRRWQRLLSPVLPRNGGWELLHGPRLRIVRSEAAQVESITLATRSPRDAELVFERYALGLRGLRLVFTQA